MIQHDPARPLAPSSKQPVAAMSHDERRAELAQVATMLRELRSLADDSRIFLLMPLLLRQVHRGEDMPADGRLEAPPGEFATWLRAFVSYLFTAANVPDVRPHAAADARWALAQIGVQAAAIDVVGAPGRLQQPAIEQLVMRLLIECPWADPARPGLVTLGPRGGARRRRGGRRSARRRGRS